MTILAIDPGPMSVTFWVPGIPKPGGSKRGFVNRKTGRVIITEDCKASKDWRISVAFAAARAIPRLFPGPLRVTFTFFLPRPHGHYGAGARAFFLRASAPDYPAVRPDITKLIRSTEDALKGIAWQDDSQIVQQVASKQYGVHGMPAGAQITIAPAGPALEPAVASRGLFAEQEEDLQR